MAETTLFAEARLPLQRPCGGGVLFPSVLAPSAGIRPSLPLLTRAIKTQKPYLESLIHEAGALLLRSFPVSSASDFNDVVEAFGYEELPYVGGAAPRTNVVGRVFTTSG